MNRNTRNKAKLAAEKWKMGIHWVLKTRPWYHRIDTQLKLGGTHKKTHNSRKDNR